MSDGHFRSLQPRIGRSLYEKSASKKVLILEKSRVKIPLVIGGPHILTHNLLKDFVDGRYIWVNIFKVISKQVQLSLG